MKILTVGLFLGLLAGCCNAWWELEVNGDGKIIGDVFHCEEIKIVRTGYGGVPVVECILGNKKKVYVSGNWKAEEK